MRAANEVRASKFGSAEADLDAKMAAIAAVARIVIGWEDAADVLPSVIGQMAAARGAEERTAWRQPVDLIDLCPRAGLELPYLFATSDNACDWSDHVTLSDSLLADDPAAIIDALTAAARDGASPADLGRALGRASGSAASAAASISRSPFAAGCP